MESPTTSSAPRSAVNLETELTCAVRFLFVLIDPSFPTSTHPPIRHSASRPDPPCPASLAAVRFRGVEHVVFHPVYPNLRLTPPPPPPRSAPTSFTTPSPSSTACTPTAAPASRPGSPGKPPAPTPAPYPRRPATPSSPARRAATACATPSTTPASPRCSRCSSR